MAQLRGYSLSGGYVEAIWPLDGETSYAGFFLTAAPKSERQDLRIRPTGENGSGPYFHAVLSGQDGVTSAVTNGSSKRITGCDYKVERTGPNSGFKDVKLYSHIFCDGPRCFVLTVLVSDPDPHWPNVGNRFNLTYYQIVDIPVPYRGRVLTYSYGGYVPYQGYSVMIDALEEAASTLLAGRDPIVGGSTISYKYSSYWEECTVLDHQPRISFENGELYAFQYWVSTGTLDSLYRGLSASAYINAATNLPRTTTNSVANVLETASLVSAILRRDWGDVLPKGAKNGWLWYRYQYSTTKADIEEYAELTRRLQTVANMQTVSTTGRASDGNVAAKCSFEVDTSSFIPSDTLGWLKSYGFALSASNVWDMVPYSFVVDWFLHISDFLEALENSDFAYSLPVRNVWTSFRSSNRSQNNYFRVPGRFTTMTPWVDYSSTGPSGKTVGKRVLDSIALFT